MEITQTLINTAVVALVGLVVTRMLQGQRQELKAEIAALRQEVKADIAALRQEVKADITSLRREMREEIADVREEIRALRSDITRIALVVGVEPRASNE